ncbi:MAG: FkbM family methyltransferase [Acidobacteria bacterium]|nr:FkbM family methyltransferase [Acidobacteriota bacterium]
MTNKLAWFKALPFWLAVRLIVLSLVRRIFRLPITFSFAQGAEDIIGPYIARYHFSMEGPGTYVDVGCNAPIKYSNTFELYLQGWRGINIDANRDLIEECRRVRKQDTSICAAISDSEREVVFHKAKSDLVSTIDVERLVEWKKHFEFSDLDQETIITKTLSSILDANLDPGRGIDLLTIDVEGHDFQVLSGLDLDRYRPKLIVVEMHEFRGIENSKIYQYLLSNEYSLKFFAVLNAYFVDERLQKNDEDSRDVS